MANTTRIDTRLEELLQRWEELREEGHTPDPSLLCRDCPELIDRFLQALRLRDELGALSVRAAYRDTLSHHQTPPGPAMPPAWPEIPGYAPRGRPLVGGMGVVFPVYHQASGRIEALKLLSGAPDEDDDAHHRFHREIAALARLDHPNIVRFYHADDWLGHAYYTMEYVAGGSLSRHLSRYRGNVRAAVALVAKMARAVQYLHEHGIVHRDLKPANILLTDAGEPKVADFGLAWLDATLKLTRPGQAQGSPSYMAPEQWQSDEIGPAADVWALGVTLYELLNGQTPFRAITLTELRVRVLTADPPPLAGRVRGADAALEAIYLRCLAKAPGDRHASTAALADGLARWQAGDRVVRRASPNGRRLWRARYPIAAMAVVLAAMFGMVFGIGRMDRSPKQPGPEAAVTENSVWQSLADQMAHGQPIVLIDAQGPPRAQRCVYDNDQINCGLAADNTFQITSLRPAWVELSPPVTWPAYRIRAQIRLDHVARKGLGGGKVGLFFARRPLVPLGTGSNLFRIEFTDFPKLHGASELDARGRPISRLFFRQTYLPPAGQSIGSAGTSWGAIKYPLPANGTPDAWHTIVIDVTPQSIMIRMDRQAPKTFLLDQMSRSVMEESQPQLMPIDRPPHGTVGLYLYQSAGSFRNVALIPFQSGT